jgi:hypothetical protein
MARRQAQDRATQVRVNEPKSTAAASGPLAEDIGPQKAINGAAGAQDLRDRIETLAYELYLRRGRQDGYDKHDWLEAERITLIQHSASTEDRSLTEGGNGGRYREQSSADR